MSRRITYEYHLCVETADGKGGRMIELNRDQVAEMLRLRTKAPIARTRTMRVWMLNTKVCLTMCSRKGVSL